jgi:hypothetical protein
MLYQYRFLMLDFEGIMRRIPAIREQHRALIKQRKAVFQQLLVGLRVEGLLKSELYPGYDEQLLTQLFVVGDFWIAHAEWLSERNTTDNHLYYQQMLRAILAPLLTDRGWDVWQRYPATIPEHQASALVNRQHSRLD